MVKYLISYDLNEADRADYSDIEKVIKQLDRQAQSILKSQWIVDAHFKNAEGICLHLDSSIGPEDQLLVVSLEMTDKCCRNIPEHLLF